MGGDGVGGGGGGGVVGPLHRTSGGSVCGQGGCQTLGLWIAGVGEEDEQKQEGWHRLRDSFQAGPSHPAMGCGCRQTLLHYRQTVKYKSSNVESEKRLQTPLGSVLPAVPVKLQPVKYRETLFLVGGLWTNI